MNLGRNLLEATGPKGTFPKRKGSAASHSSSPSHASAIAPDRMATLGEKFKVFTAMTYVSHCYWRYTLHVHHRSVGEPVLEECCALCELGLTSFATLNA